MHCSPAIRPLSDPPRIDLWPAAVRSAETLRGTLVRCGPGLRLAAWPDTPRVRSAALAPWLTPDRVAVVGTAAWIWGAQRDPDPRLEYSTTGARGPDPAGPDEPLVHEFALAPDEIRAHGSYLVTDPLRTACDLLRSSEGFGATRRIACRLLLRLVPGGGETARERIVAGGRVRRRTALERLAAL